jgi:hypothetical protein
MSAIAGSFATAPGQQKTPPARPRTEAKRGRITEVAMRHFAEHGFESARISDIADELGIAKGSIFQHFGTRAQSFNTLVPRMGFFSKFTRRLLVPSRLT